MITPYGHVSGEAISFSTPLRETKSTYISMQNNYFLAF